MEKKNVIVFILSFIILALAGLGFYAWKSAQPAPAVAQPQPTPTPTAQIPKDWKTYENTKYHYSFRYPKEYYIYQLAGEGVLREVSNDADEILINRERERRDRSIFSISGTNLENLSIEGIKNQFEATNPNDIRLIQTKIVNRPAYTIEFKKDNNWQSSPFFYVQNMHRQVLVLNFSPENSIVSNQIFSSLTFTN